MRFLHALGQRLLFPMFVQEDNTAYLASSTCATAVKCVLFLTCTVSPVANNTCNLHVDGFPRFFCISVDKGAMSGVEKKKKY